MFDPIRTSIDFIFKGGPVMVPIFLFSLIALSIIFERLYYFHKNKEKPEVIFNAVKKLLSNKKYDQGIELVKTYQGPVSRLIETGIEHRREPDKKLKELLGITVEKEIEKLVKNMRALEVIATVSPLMGLLGTVIGMVQAFGKVAEHSGQVDPSILAGGIWVALLTTAAGLAVAIPASIMLHFFDRKIEIVSSSLSVFGQQLLHLIADLTYTAEDGEQGASGSIKSTV